MVEDAGRQTAGLAAEKAAPPSSAAAAHKDRRPSVALASAGRKQGIPTPEVSLKGPKGFPAQDKFVLRQVVTQRTNRGLSGRLRRAQGGGGKLRVLLQNAKEETSKAR